MVDRHTNETHFPGKLVIGGGGCFGGGAAEFGLHGERQ